MSERHAIACEAGAKALDRYRPGTSAAGLLRDLATKLKAPKREPAKPPKSEWATMKEEITRKALETIQEAQMRLMLAEITEREAWCIANAVYDTVSGLVDWEIAQLIYAARQELKEHAPK